MERDIIKIDEELCNGCGECVPGCHEGALQIIDGKARLISDLMCDGLGACLGHCPMGAMEIERREADPYNETTVIKLMLEKGFNTVVAHLRHLKDHNEYDFIKEAMAYLSSHEAELDFTMSELKNAIHAEDKPQEGGCGGGCPGSQSQEIKRPAFTMPTSVAPQQGGSELQQWPVQMHLINPGASFFQGADMVLAADCAPFAMGNFHSTFLKNKVLGIACPKLDNGQETYLNKLITLINDSKINSLTVVIMEVPCCGGLMAIAQQAVQLASRKVPLKRAVVSIQGEVLSEDWV
ncbi:ATP-binding protein [Saccharicrinis aurantiacus]|uniref:ATP-binding protein n=1 Tax=Saccharicrinis aurantiacus TaxID=1849719 RepID=UPI00094FED93|nr:4Fe-4S binding protein [Saccharicrinis aurantiacus]